MRSQRKIKLRFKILGISLVLLMVIGGLSQTELYPLLTIPNYKILLDQGYSKEAILDLKERLPEALFKSLKDEAYHMDIYERLTLQGYAPLDDCGYPTEMILELINLPVETQTLFIESAYPDILSQLYQEPYFVLDRLARYQELTLKRPELPIYNIIQRVNADRDYPLYSVIEAVDLSRGITMLVNKYHQLEADYVPELKASTESGGFMMVPDAADALDALLKDMKAEGLDILVSNTYRSYDLQSILYNRYLLKDPQGVVDGYSARPGHSEHQAGLAVDFKTSTADITGFSGSKADQWLKEKAHLYGFIQRYTAENYPLTGYQEESWHYRFVGKEAAQLIYDTHITLEEYVVLNP